MHVGSRTTVVGVPFLLRDSKGLRHVLHAGMRLIFDANGSRTELWDVILKLDRAHEVRKPRPYRLPVELTQERRVMQPHPTAPAVLDISLEGRHRFRRPAVRDKVQLKHQAIP